MRQRGGCVDRSRTKIGQGSIKIKVATYRMPKSHLLFLSSSSTDDISWRVGSFPIIVDETAPKKMFCATNDCLSLTSTPLKQTEGRVSSNTVTCVLRVSRWLVQPRSAKWFSLLVKEAHVPRIFGESCHRFKFS